MNRPWILRLAPEVLRGRLWYRFYRGRSGYEPLFDKAALSHADGVSMYDLVVSDYISQCVAFLGVFEPWLSRRVRSLAAGDGKLLVDVGANMGYFTLIWLAANPCNRAVAFEPGGRNLQLLRKNLEQNSLAESCSVHAKACSNRTGIVSFDSGPDAQTGWGSIAVTDASRTTEVEAVTLDGQFDGSETIDLLKIDTEGADFLVLQGAEGLLRAKRVRNIYFEMNIPGLRALGSGPDDVLRFLDAVGYRYACVDAPGRPVSTWYAHPV